MARYTFTCEHFSYNDFGDENNIASKHTTEFRADTLETMIENFEMFLRGSGFVFDGVIDVVPMEDSNDCEEDLRAIDEFVSDQRGHRVFSSMVDDLLKDDGKVILSGINDFDNQHSFNFDNMAAGQPTFTVNSIENINISSLSDDYIVSFDSNQIPAFTTKNLNLDEINISFNEYCEVCHLPKSVMQSHKCYDEKCPVKVS
jgi:hypothetical protein